GRDEVARRVHAPPRRVARARSVLPGLLRRQLRAEGMPLSSLRDPRRSDRLRRQDGPPMTRRAKTLLLTSPIWVAGAYIGIAIGFGIAVGVRGAWQDRRRVFRPYEQFGDRR